ncbi:19275_t:CDS:1, partial [Gigaspora rosea]
IQSEQMAIVDPLVTEHRGRPATKRLKSSSESQSHKEPAHTIIQLLLKIITYECLFQLLI